MRQLNKNVKFLIHLPSDNIPLRMQWRGPFRVVKKVGDLDYTMEIGDKENTFHLNMLKKYEDKLPT